MTEGADKLWNNSATTDDHRESLVTLYETYTSIVSKWKMDNLNNYLNQAQESE